MILKAHHKKMSRVHAKSCGFFMVVTVISSLLATVAHQAQAQQTSATYNISNALDSVNANTFLSATPGLSNLLAVNSLTVLTATAVQVESCLAGSYSPDDAQTCTLCPTGTYSQTVIATSINTCIPCSSGKYQNITGASSTGQCLDCPSNTYFNRTAGTSISVCDPCPPLTLSFPGSQLLQSCFCAPGYSGPNGKKSVIKSFLHGENDA